MARSISGLRGLGCVFALLTFGLLAGALASPARAGPPDTCGAIADRTERAQDIPPGLLHAVALAESGRWEHADGMSRAWPWTVRSGPDGFYLPSKAAALHKVRALRSAGRKNIDVGCMQINLGYHGHVFASLEEAFDPASNVAYGARYLKELQRQTRSWAGATGRYHSGNRERGRAYRARVYRLWRDLRRQQGAPSPMITQAQFLGDGLRRLVGGAAAGRSRNGPSGHLISPGSGAASSRDAKGAEVLRGR